MLALLATASRTGKFGDWAGHAEKLAAARSEKLDVYLNVLYMLLEDLLLMVEGGRPLRNPDIEDRLSAIAGAVFSGSYDGGLRAYSTTDGTLLWQVDTNRDYQTINGVTANGATLDGGGAVVVDGMLYVNSGYNGIVGRAGNVLLAFEVR